jgi:hypothetical protein
MNFTGTKTHYRQAIDASKAACVFQAGTITLP